MCRKHMVAREEFNKMALINLEVAIMNVNITAYHRGLLINPA